MKKQQTTTTTHTFKPLSVYCSSRTRGRNCWLLDYGTPNNIHCPGLLRWLSPCFGRRRFMPHHTPRNCTCIVHVLRWEFSQVFLPFRLTSPTYARTRCEHAKHGSLKGGGGTVVHLHEPIRTQISTCTVRRPGSKSDLRFEKYTLGLLI